MTLAPRAHTAPRGVRAAWAVGSAAGATALLLTALPNGTTGPATAATSSTSQTPADAPPAFPGKTAGGLRPGTLTDALSNVLPGGASDPKVSGVYGSGHYGNWQFTAFLLWHAPDGTVNGGRVDLPAAGDTPPEPLDLHAGRLQLEYDAGWTLVRLDRAVGDLDTLEDLQGTATRLALLELEIPAGQPAVLTDCSTATTPRAAEQAANCLQQTDGGEPTSWRTVLTDDPTAGSLSVQRANR